MRSAPSFWWLARPTLPARLLGPVGSIYGAVTGRRMGRPGTTLEAPMLCVGNLVAGGAGKTPAAIAIARRLQEQGHSPAFLSRGYGRAGASRAVIHVDPTRHTADDVGDEPLLLARVAPTFVSVDRLAAGRSAIAAGASLLVLDDGLQSPGLRKQLSLAVVDGRTGVGNGLCVPAGPLRAPLAAQWPFVSAVCLIGPGEPGERVGSAARARGLPVWQARLEPDADTLRRLEDRPLYAFAGIGLPSKFFETLAGRGLRLVGTRAFPDHHRFSDTDIDDLGALASKLGATLVTTEKDRVRLPGAFATETLPVTLAFDDENGFSDWLARRLRSERD